MCDCLPVPQRLSYLKLPTPTTLRDRAKRPSLHVCRVYIYAADSDFCVCESSGALLCCFEACVLGVGEAEQGAPAWPAALLHLCCDLTVTPAFGCVCKCVLSLFCA